METSLPLLRGTLDVMILKALSWGEVHGYGISRWIRDTTGGVFEVQEGALYPALRRLERRGLVASRWTVTERGREARVYALTVSGTKALQREMGTWTSYVSAMTRVLDAASPGGVVAPERPGRKPSDTGDAVRSGARNARE